MFRTCTLVIIMDSINVMAVITFHSLYYIHFASIFFSIWHTQAQIPGSATAGGAGRRRSRAVAPTSPAAGRAVGHAGQKDGGDAGDVARRAWRRWRRARVCSISSQ